jgi:hypothetical protein
MNKPDTLQRCHLYSIRGAALLVEVFENLVDQAHQVYA